MQEHNEFERNLTATGRTPLLVEVIGMLPHPSAAGTSRGFGTGAVTAAAFGGNRIEGIFEDSFEIFGRVDGGSSTTLKYLNG